MRGDQIVKTQLLMAQSFGALADLVTNSTCYALPSVTFEELPAEPVAGMLGCIVDSSVTSGDVTEGGGGNIVLIWFNGTTWKVLA